MNKEIKSMEDLLDEGLTMLKKRFNKFEERLITLEDRAETLMDTAKEVTLCQLLIDCIDRLEKNCLDPDESVAFQKLSMGFSRLEARKKLSKKCAHKDTKDPED